jgi:hypothetical protein
MNTSTRFINTSQYSKMVALSLLKTKSKIGLVFGLTAFVIALIVILIRTFSAFYNTQVTASVYKFEYAHNVEPANKRHLIVTLQSIRMHNVTRYQRSALQNQRLIQNIAQQLQSPHVSLLNTVQVHSMSAEPSEAVTNPVESVQQGW